MISDLRASGYSRYLEEMKMDKIREYERRKAEIEATATSYEEYKERIEKLIRELRL